MCAVPEHGWAVWITGFPGCGKSTLASALLAVLQSRGWKVVHLEMDQLRKQYCPEPKYTAEEREMAYRMFVEDAADLVRMGTGVIMDATAHKLALRSHARRTIRKFAEIELHCPLGEAMRREGRRPEGLVMVDMYKKALERKQSGKQFEGLGDVIGVDVPFESDPSAECVIHNQKKSPQLTLEIALSFLDSWLEGD